MKNKLNLALETVLKELELKSKELKLNSFTTRIRISKRLEESLTDSSLSDLSSSSDEEENFKHQPQNKLKSRSKPLNSSMQSSKNLIPYLPSGRDKKVVAKITALASKKTLSLPTDSDQIYSPTAASYRIQACAAAQQRGLGFIKHYNSNPIFQVGLGENPAYYLNCSFLNGKKCKYRLRISETKKGWCCNEIIGRHNHSIRLLKGFEKEQLKVRRRGKGMGKVKNFFREVSDSSDGDIVGEDSDDEMEENPDEEEDKESDLEMEEVVASSSKSSNSNSVNRLPGKQRRQIDSTKLQSPRSTPEESSPRTIFPVSAEKNHSRPSTSLSSVVIARERLLVSDLTQKKNLLTSSSSTLTHFDSLPLASTSKRPPVAISDESAEVNRTRKVSLNSQTSVITNSSLPANKKTRLSIVENQTSPTFSSSPSSRTPILLTTSGSIPARLSSSTIPLSLPSTSTSLVPLPTSTFPPSQPTILKPDPKILKTLQSFLHHLKPTLSNEKYVLFLYHSGITSKESLINLLGLDCIGLDLLLDEFKEEDKEKFERGEEGVGKLPMLFRSVLKKEVGEVQERERILGVEVEG